MLIRILKQCAMVSALVAIGCDAQSAKPGNKNPANTNAAVAKQAKAAPTLDYSPKNPNDDAPPTAVAEKPTPAAATAATGPSWEITQDTYEFGQIWTGRVILHPFEIKNVGTEPLHLSKPKAHCSCSSPDAYPSAIAPGEKGQIMYRLNLTNKAGPVHETLEAQTDDPQKPILRVNMTGFARTVCEQIVTEDLAAIEGRMPPDRLEKLATLRGDFGRITTNENLFRVIQLRNMSGAPLTLTMRPKTRASISDNTGKTRAVPPMFDATLKELTPGELYELTLKGKPPFADYYNNFAVDFETGIAEYPVYSVMAYAYCPPRFEMVPSKMVFNREMATARNRTIRITNNGTTPFDVTAVACSDPNFAITLFKPRPETPNVTEINVIFPTDPNYVPPPYGEIIRINTTDSENPQVDLYVLPTMSDPATQRPADKPLEFHPGKVIG